ncbi:MAG: DUF3298 and DUF4163 domain-containing protein [Oscillospiraceae bacterium]|nr:DUF3298 and DUF4163 domain-containing protein [Oscillospiraceae bacterium]
MEILETKREFNVKSEDIVLVNAKIRLPKINGRSKAARRVNAYYEAVAKHWERYAGKALAKHAKKQRAFLTKHGFPFRAFDFAVDFTVTLNDDDILSLYTDRYEYCGGANGVTVREGHTWKDGFPLRLKAMESQKRIIKRQIIELIKQRQTENFFEPVKRLVGKHYSPEQWYLTPSGVTVFYQEVTVAPHIAGIMEFEVNIPPAVSAVLHNP